MENSHTSKASAPRSPLYPLLQTAVIEGEHLLYAFGRLFVSRGGKWLVVEAF